MNFQNVLFHLNHDFVLARGGDVFPYAEDTFCNLAPFCLVWGCMVLLEDKMPISFIIDGRNALGYIFRK